MRTIISAQGCGEADESLRQDGPLCFHGDPTVLRVLNGRNVYVCARYPKHHCRACCPLDVMLLDEARPPSPTPDPSIPFGSPLATSPLSAEEGSPMAQDDGTDSNNPHEADNEQAQPMSPDSNSISNVGTPVMPPAPTKPSSHGSVSSRAVDSGAARSLTPLFNRFAPAAVRASQLGGRFAMLRPNASAIARMQRQVSGNLEAQYGAGASDTKMERSPDECTQRKRARIDGADMTQCDKKDQGAPSVNTASLGQEPRLTPWIRATVGTLPPFRPPWQ